MIYIISIWAVLMICILWRECARLKRECRYLMFENHRIRNEKPLIIRKCFVHKN